MDTEIKLFPSNSIQALALAYAQHRADDDSSPEDFCRFYWIAYYRIAAVNQETMKRAKTGDLK